MRSGNALDVGILSIYTSPVLADDSPGKGVRFRCPQLQGSNQILEICCFVKYNANFLNLLKWLCNFKANYDVILKSIT
jgi:hypothetical protein